VPDPDYPANSIAIEETIKASDYIITSDYVSVLDFCFDSNNTMWILTNKGLIRKSETDHEYIYSLHLTEEKYAKTITIDHSNRLWINTLNGIVCYDYSHSNFDIYNEENSNIPQNSTSKIFCDENSDLYFVYYTGVMKFENDQWVEDSRFPGISNFEIPVLDFNRSNPVLIKQNDYFWLAVKASLIKYKNDSTFEYFTPENSDLSGHFLKSIYKDNMDRIWITDGINVQLFDNNNWTTHSGRYNFSITGDYIFSEDYLYGIKLLKNHEWVDIFSEYYFKIISYNKSRVDNEGNLWLSDYERIYKIKTEVLQ